MDLDRLKHFQAVAECQSFTKAGARLHLTQAAVSYQVSALEQDIGVKLFHRDSHRVSLTRVGTFLLKEVQEVMAKCENAMDQARKMEAGLVGEMTVGYLDGSERALLPTYFRSFTHDHPEVLVQFQRHTIPSLIHALEEGRVDVAFTVSVGLANLKGFEFIKLFSDFPVVLMLQDHPLACRSALTVEDLVGLPMVCMATEVSAATSDWLGDLFARHKVRPNIVRTAMDPGTLMMLVESGLGVTVLTRRVAAQFTNANLHLVDLVSEEAKVDALVLWKGGRDNPSVPLFLNSMGIPAPPD